MMHDFVHFLHHFRRAMHYVRAVLLVLLLMLTMCTVMLMLSEGLELGEAAYFTVITALSIGYGDITPATFVGRMTSIVAGLIGMLCIGLTVAVSNIALSQLADEKKRHEATQPKH